MRPSRRRDILLIAVALIIFQYINTYSLIFDKLVTETVTNNDLNIVYYDDEDDGKGGKLNVTLIQHHEEVEQKMKNLVIELKDSRKEVETLKLKLHDANDETVESGNHHTTTATTATTATTDTASSVFESNEICSHFPSESQSVSRLWHKYLPQVMKASINPHLTEFLTDEEDTKRREILEQVLSPSRMRQSIVHLPSFSHGIIKNVVEIIQKRIQDPENNPPLQVAVFGGSVTFGTKCTPNKTEEKVCAWPMRLELLINQFIGMDVVKVHNLAVGGTDSTTPVNLIKYWMYPDELKKSGPDVIINGGSANDALPPSDLKPEDDWVTATSNIVEMRLQPFIREALQSKICSIQPLVIHMDDYLGPQQEGILGELQLSNVVSQYARWYDLFAISYAEVVRDVVYQDIKDPTFFNGNDVHFGRWAHQTIAWAIGFASLELLQNYCDDEYIDRTRAAQITTGSIAYGNITSAIDASSRDGVNKGNGFDADTLLKHNIRKYKFFLPPPLTRELILKNATEEFNSALNDAHKSLVENNCSDLSQEEDMSPCIVSWISTPGGFDRRRIINFMRDHVSDKRDWGTEKNVQEGWLNKFGLVPKAQNATFTLKFDKIAKNVKTFTLYFMRSYGIKWKDSGVKVTLSRIRDADNSTEVVLERMISGFHKDVNYKYSLTTPELMVLEDPLLKGETMTVKVDFVSGNTFKIMGMFLCNK